MLKCRAVPLEEGIDEYEKDVSAKVEDLCWDMLQGLSRRFPVVAALDDGRVKGSKEGARGSSGADWITVSANLTLEDRLLMLRTRGRVVIGTFFPPHES